MMKLTRAFGIMEYDKGTIYVGNIFFKFDRGGQLIAVINHNNYTAILLDDQEEFLIRYVVDTSTYKTETMGLPELQRRATMAIHEETERLINKWVEDELGIDHGHSG